MQHSPASPITSEPQSAAPATRVTSSNDIAISPASSLKELLGQIVELLREELQQHGETLALLEQHAGLVEHRRLDDLLESATAVNRPITAVRLLRHRRGAYARVLARRLNLREDAHLSSMMPLVPSDYRLLMEALIQENEELSLRVTSCIERIPWCPPTWSSGR